MILPKLLSSSAKVKIFFVAIWVNSSYNKAMPHWDFASYSTGFFLTDHDPPRGAD